MSQILRLTRNLYGKCLSQMLNQRASDSLFTCTACQRLRNVYSTQVKLKSEPMKPKKAKWRIKKEKKKALAMYKSLQESIHEKQDQIASQPSTQNISHQADLKADLKVPHETLEILNEHIEKLKGKADKPDSMKALKTDTSVTADKGVSVKKQKISKILQKDKEKLDAESQTDMSSDVLHKPNKKKKAKAVINSNVVSDKNVHKHKTDNTFIKEMWSNGETKHLSLQEKVTGEQVDIGVSKLPRQKKERKKSWRKSDQKVISKAAYVKNTDIAKVPALTLSVQTKEIASPNTTDVVLGTDVEMVHKTDNVSAKQKAKHKRETDSDNKEVISEMGSNSDVKEKSTVTDQKSSAVTKKNKKVVIKKNVSKLESCDVQGAIQVFNEDFRSYVDACCYIGQVKKAYDGIRFYQNQVRKGQARYQIKDVEIYNILIQAMANLGKVDSNTHSQNLLSIMVAGGVQPNLQTYAMILYTLAQRKTEAPRMAQSVMHDMKAGGFEVSDIFTKLPLEDKERQGILQVLRWVNPEYEPPKHKEAHAYRGPLVEELNDPLPKSEIAEANPYTGILTAEEIVQKANVQFQRELENFVHVKPVMKVSDREPEKEKQKKQLQDKLEQMRKKWHYYMTKAFRAKVLNMQKKFNSSLNMSLYPFFKLLPEEVFIDLLLKEIEYLGVINEHHSPASHAVYKDLGQKVCNRFRIQLMVDSNRIPKLKTIFRRYTEETMDPNLEKLNHRMTWLKIQNEVMNGLPLTVDEKQWSPLIKKALGKELYEIIFSAVKVPAKQAGRERMVPAFFTVIRQKELEMEEQIKPHPEYMKLVSCENKLMFHTTELPLLVPSLPWVTPTQGGNFFSTGKTLRWHIPRQMTMFKKYSDTGPVLDSLNILGACPWKVNKPILDLIIYVFNKGGDSSLDIPILPASIEKPQKPEGELSKEDKIKYYTASQAYHKHYGEENSLWYHALYKFSIANMFRDEIFWFPISMDFRGRTYAIPPHFNHLCGDTARAIIRFAKEKPLGPDGLDWLKIHLVNLTGLKKRCSNAERLEYANELMPKILDSADKPLEGERWWTTSEYPWQTLACCMEIANASRSEDPTKFLSGYPVHQDGSCNGLQHYAALGRDTAGAKSVNLYPFDKPSDVYQEVVDLVEKKRQKDLESHNVKLREAAKICKGHVERKVIKQTIMTTVYGVTEYGARLQIARQLKERGMPKKQSMTARSYLASSTFECLQQMFSSAKQIQDWFNACAVNICSTSNRSVEWVTPLNFPVVQPYFRHLRASGSGVMITSYMHESQFPNVMKQKNAFAPNYVHSLDSAHMMLTSLYCLRAGITFVSVHDCFWTHPCDVKVLNKVTREQFVSLHNQPILENLSKYFVKTFYKGPADDDIQSELTSDLETNQSEVTDPETSQSEVTDPETSQSYVSVVSKTNQSNSAKLREAERMEKLKEVLTAVPERGDFDLEKVLESTYFFS